MFYSILQNENALFLICKNKFQIENIGYIMRIKNIEIENFRGFKHLKVDFPQSNLTVFIGVNGAGKTSILDGISMPLAGLIGEICYKPDFISNTLLYQSNSPFVYKNRIMYGENSAKLHCELENEFGNYNWQCRIKKNVTSEDTTSEDNYSDFIHSVKSKLDANETINLPVFLYFNENKNHYHISENVKNNFNYQQLEMYRNAFHINYTHFPAFFDWYNQAENIENEIRLNENDKYRLPELEAIRKAVVLFSEQFHGWHFDTFRVQRHPEKQFVLENKTQKIPFNALSNGEKSMFFLIADIARRLAIANPLRSNPLLGKGIILIDEIELHLHPQWQFQILSSLTTVFPNLQFLTTTHSPLVISQVEQKDIFVLDDFKIFNAVSDPKGRDINTILEEIFETPRRQVEIQKIIDECFRLISFNQLDKAKEKLKELSSIIHSDNPILAKINSTIKRKELIGR